MVRLPFKGLAKGNIEEVEIDVTSVVRAGRPTSLIQPVLLGAADRLWLTIGAEGSATCSVAACAWRFEEVEEQWNRLILESSADGLPCRPFPLAELGVPRSLILRVTGTKRLPVGVAFFCGIPTGSEEPRPGQRLKAVLEDPVLGRRLVHGCPVRGLPFVS